MKRFSISAAPRMLGPRWISAVFLGCFIGLIGVDSGTNSAVAQEVCPLPAGVEVSPLATPSTTAGEVAAGTGSLSDFALAAKGYLESVGVGPELIHSACLLRNEEDWNTGSIYVVTMSPTGRVFFHSKDGALSGRQLKPAVRRAIAAATGLENMGATVSFRRPDGGDLSTIGGYAVGYRRGANPLILVAGLDIGESDLVDEDAVAGDPDVRADEVVDRASLKAFVKGAQEYVLELFRTDGREAFTRAKSALRDPDGPWRYGPIYLFIMEPTGYTIFHGAFPNRFEFQRPTGTLRDVVTGELILPQIIEVATSNPDGGFVTYYFDNPDDDTDSADIPKVTYARQHVFEVAGPDGSTRPYPLIFGAGIYGDPQAQESAAGPKNWLARFGRAVAGQAVEMISNRMTGPSADASQVTLAGQSMFRGAATLAQSGPVLDPGDPARWQNTDPWPPQEDSWTGYRTMSLSDVLLNSSFRIALTGGDGDGAGDRWTAWGSGGLTGFAGDEGVSLDGNVMTGMLGVDYEQGPMLTGVAVSLARGDGSFDLAGARTEMEATLTSVYPHVRYAMSEQFSLWGILGLGQGEMTLDETATGSTVETGIDMRMGALGVRGELLSAAGEDGIDVALKSDVLLTQMTSDATEGLASTKAGTTRFRAMLEGSRLMALESGASLRPSVEAGLRHDGGDAGEGAGLELGGRIVYMDPSWGLTIEAGGRTLLAQRESGSREWGVDGSVRLAPGAQGRGFSFTMGSTWGEASSDVEHLWAQRSATDLARGHEEPVAGFGAEVGYGFAAPGLGLLTPYGGLTASNRGTATYLAGGRLDVGGSFRVSLEGDRRESIDGDPEHGITVRGSLRW